MGFLSMRGVELEQPIFGANFLKGTVVAEPGGKWTGEAEKGFQLWFWWLKQASEKDCELWNGWNPFIIKSWPDFHPLHIGEFSPLYVK